MKIVAIKERFKDETRVAITPDSAKMLIRKGHKVFVEKDIGVDSGFTDEDYKNAGAKVSNILLEIISDADIILKVQSSPLLDQYNEIEMSKAGAIIIGLLSPYDNSEYFKKAENRRLSTISMELVPRITKAQNMDVLSSQSNLAGYRAVIEASYHYNRAFPMMMTAAGTVNPAKILVIGVGVAGLQAIATAKRLGGSVSAYDVRAATKEQAESLGAKFVYPTELNSDAEDKSGYAKEVTKDFAKIQEKFFLDIIGKFDIVITTAQIPGKKAPMLLTEKMLEKMNPGSVIVDMATSTGGNVKGSVVDKIIEKKNVKIIGWSNLATKIAGDSSKLYSRNLYNFLDYAIKEKTINFDDDLVKAMTITKDGKIINAYK